MSDLLNENDFAYKHKHNRTIYWLRWIFFIPVAYLLSRAVLYSEGFIEKIVTYFSKYIIRLPLLWSSLSDIVFMGTVKFIAPSNKKITGWIIIISYSVMLVAVSLIIANAYVNDKNRFSIIDYYLIREWIVTIIVTILVNIFYKGERLFGLSSDF
ncbi:MAG TPA: hypothetical protein VK559_02310 [Ferruginibacter sp.]|nr:hypothetical protein [Ferruginibacter sp.]